ncbi:MAG TPA: hypothetical protein VMW20_10050 [Candidatus Nanoarchaeia archaeon]|nr:hypothetical protein [Candidatus Nanoarchaeia archaeon]
MAGTRISYKVLSVFEIIKTDLDKVEAITRYLPVRRRVILSLIKIEA